MSIWIFLISRFYVNSKTKETFQPRIKFSYTKKLATCNQKASNMQTQFCSVFLVLWHTAKHCWMHFDHWVTISKEFWNQNWLEWQWHPGSWPISQNSFLVSSKFGHAWEFAEYGTWTRDFLRATLGWLAFVCARVLGLEFLDILQFATELALRKPWHRAQTGTAVCELITEGKDLENVLSWTLSYIPGHTGIAAGGSSSL